MFATPAATPARPRRIPARFWLAPAFAAAGLLGCGGGSLDLSFGVGGAQARITEFGLYARGTEIAQPDPNSPSGQSRSSVGFKLETSTQLVPLLLGISFGFCFEVSGAAVGASPSVQVRVQHPPIVRPDGSLQNSFVFEPPMYRFAGFVWSCGGYGFDHANELAAGTWRFSVVVDGVVLAIQVFVAR